MLHCKLFLLLSGILVVTSCSVCSKTPSSGTPIFESNDSSVAGNDNHKDPLVFKIGPKELALQPINGEYTILLDTLFSEDIIKEFVNDKQWRVICLGELSPNGFNEDIDGFGEFFILFSGSQAHIVSKPIDFRQSVYEYDRSVAYGKNSIVIGENEMIVYSIQDGRVFMLQKTHYSNRWLYYCLIENPILEQ